MSNLLPKRQLTRAEKYLAKMAGAEEVQLPPKPLTRLEKYLAAILNTVLEDAPAIKNRVVSLDQTQIAIGNIVEAIGKPVYVKNAEVYPDWATYGLTEPGWYVFAKILPKDGGAVSPDVTVTGAAGYVVKANQIDVAVRFEVAATSQIVNIDWGDEEESFIFRATDAAIDNLDYRVTFYVYPIDDYTTWEYQEVTDEAFEADKHYYLHTADGYELAEIPTGAVPVYYTKTDTYTETTDETFVDGKDYYILDPEDGKYWLQSVVVGDVVAGEEDTYYELTTTYTKATGSFEDGVTYYKKSGVNYEEVTVTPGDSIVEYYAHSKVTFEGMTRNVTYVCNTPIDCPVVFNLPEIEDDTHGAWFEVRFYHEGSYSSTLVTPTGVKVATEHTQPETKGFNSVDLHYSSIAGIKMWRFLNTHSTLPS